MKLAFLGLAIYLLVANAMGMVLNTRQAWLHRQRRWANRLPNYFAAVLASLFLVLYPSTGLPERVVSATSLSAFDQYFLGLGGALLFHMAAIGGTLFKRSMRDGRPRSFIVHYLRLVFTKSNAYEDGADLVVALEYVPIGIAGGLLGLAFAPLMTQPALQFLTFGLGACLLGVALATLMRARHY